MNTAVQKCSGEVKQTHKLSLIFFKRNKIKCI